jgi:hypothetical protein
MRLRRPFVLALSALVAACLLAACSTPGGKRRVSEPAAGIQQLTVLADGRWEVQLRLNNFSNVPMRFESAELRIAFDGTAVATVQAQPQLGIGPESADVFTATIVPLAQGRARIATALADGRGVEYALEGELRAAPENGNARAYKIKRNSALSPVPGLPGVLR